jgi:hypothetical protein
MCLSTMVPGSGRDRARLSVVASSAVVMEQTGGPAQPPERPVHAVLEGLAAISGVVDKVAGAAGWSLSDAEVRDAVRAGARVLARVESTWLGLVRELDHGDLHAGTWTLTMIHGQPWARPPAWLHPDRPLLRNTTHTDLDHARQLGEHLNHQLHLTLEPEACHGRGVQQPDPAEDDSG